MAKRRERLAVVGVGTLGLPLALVFAKAGYYVCGVDKVNRVKEIIGCASFLEPLVSDNLKKYRDRLLFTSEYEKLKDCTVVFILVQTPSLENGRYDIQYVVDAIESIRSVNSGCLIVISSTVNVGDTHSLCERYGEIVCNPEFVARGSLIKDFTNRIGVVGFTNLENATRVLRIWDNVNSKKKVFSTDPNTAEMLKIVSNLNIINGIVFSSVIGEFCEKFDVDADRIFEMLYEDRKLYRKGLGYAGPCFVRDVQYFKYEAASKAISTAVSLAKFLQDINDDIVMKWEKEIEKACDVKKSKKVGIIGVAYKANVPFIDYSQSIQIAKKLLKEDYQVFVYDKMAMEIAKSEIPEAYFCDSIEECVGKSDILFIGLPDKDFTELKTDKVIINPWR